MQKARDTKIRCMVSANQLIGNALRALNKAGLEMTWFSHLAFYPSLAYNIARNWANRDGWPWYLHCIITFFKQYAVQVFAYR